MSGNPEQDSELVALRRGTDHDGIEDLAIDDRQNKNLDRKLVPRSKKIWIGASGIFIFLLLVVLVVLAALYLPGHVDPRLFMPTRPCTGDGFSKLTYNHTDGSSRSTKRFLKYKYVEDMEHDRMYNFYEAKDKCEEMNSTLWEILDGVDEWEAVIGMAIEKDLTGIWLNAQVTGSCPSVQSTCLENEADEGRGVGVRFPSSRHAKYSRLYSAPTMHHDSSCVVVDKHTETLLWTISPCNKHDFYGLCIKRDCFPE